MPKTLLALATLITSLLCLTSCKSTPNISSIKSAERLIKKIEAGDGDIIGIAEQAVNTQQHIEKDINNINQLIDELSEIVGKKWGDEKAKVPSNKRLVKYTNDYKARAVVDFEQGSVLVETLVDKTKSATIANLQQAIITTLLATSDHNETDIFSSDAPKLGGTPTLYQQVLDQDNKAIRYQWRAQRFANYLMANALQQYSYQGKQIFAVKITMVERHQHLRKLQYSEFVLASAKRYQLSPQLIYGIIETESSFNPFAVSHANAYGLMQVVPKTAGADVFQKIKKRSGMPTKAQLFDPAFNIDIGSAYLSILHNNYLNKVTNNTSRHYAVISAYNGGAGNVLKTFHSNRKTAMNVINGKAPNDVYYHLTKRHPKAESRRYLEKVTKAEKSYK